MEVMGAGILKFLTPSPSPRMERGLLSPLPYTWGRGPGMGTIARKNQRDAISRP